MYGDGVLHNGSYWMLRDDPEVVKCHECDGTGFKVPKQCKHNVFLTTCDYCWGEGAIKWIEHVKNPRPRMRENIIQISGACPECGIGQVPCDRIMTIPAWRGMKRRIGAK